MLSWKEINTGHNHSIIDTFNQFYGIYMQVAEAVMEYNKPAEWSEEDKQTFIKSVEALEDFGKFELADWLKEHKNQYLRPQSQWKPSDEQMSALSKAIAFVFDSNSDVKHSLESLYNELKKL